MIKKIWTRFLQINKYSKVKKNNFKFHISVHVVPLLTPQVIGTNNINTSSLILEKGIF